MAGTQVVRFGIVSPQFSIDFRLNGTWRQEGSQLIRTLMGCECADLSSRVGQFCRLSRERLDPRARKRDRRLNMPIKQSVYRLADEPRATILVRTSSATNAGTDKDSDKRQRTAITGVIGRRQFRCCCRKVIP